MERLGEVSTYSTTPIFIVIQADKISTVSIFGFIGLGIIPMSMLFVRYGAYLREKSHFVRKADELVAGMRNYSSEVVQEIDEGGVVGKDVERIGWGREDSEKSLA